ncbi:MAG TPA: cupin domain-containing protein [Candidatus Limnocylindria bacterium]|nr:cupin domain-containing protein [Candidatus Limnocylindria bacterium]
MAPLPLTPSVRGKATLERPVTLVLALALAACAPRPPRVAVGELAAGLEDFLAAHPLAADQDIRADEVSRTASASYHLVQVRGSERPHRHAAHDLTVFVLRGRGTLALGEVRRALAAGDAAVIPRGAVHWFANGGRAPALALVVFTPPLDAPDTVPAEAR